MSTNFLPTRRIRIVILLIITLAMVLLSSTSLSGLVLMPGQPLPGAESTDLNAPNKANHAIPGPSVVEVSNAVLALITLVIGIIVLIRLLLRIQYKQFLKYVAGLVVIIILLNLIPEGTKHTPTVLNAESPPPQTQFEISTTTLGIPPQGLMWVIYIAAIMLVIVFIFLLFRRNPAKKMELNTQIAFQLENAIEAIKSGNETRNVIIRCYMQMSQAIRDNQGILREESMSPHEFQEFLISRGFPKDPIGRLTQLFEKVRYGHSKTSAMDNNEARESLEAILSYCQNHLENTA